MSVVFGVEDEILRAILSTLLPCCCYFSTLTTPEKIREVIVVGCVCDAWNS